MSEIEEPVEARVRVCLSVCLCLSVCVCVYVSVRACLCLSVCPCLDALVPLPFLYLTLQLTVDVRLVVFNRSDDTFFSLWMFLLILSDF